MATTLPRSTFGIDVEDDGVTVLVRPRGELDLATAPKLRAAIAAAMAFASVTLIVDMTGVTFVDSSGITELLAAHALAHAAGRSFIVRRPGPSLKLLRLLGIEWLVDLEPVGSSPA